VGTGSIGANSTVYLEPNGSWTNSGAITLASNAALYLYGSFTAAALGTITNSGGTIFIGGALDNTGNTLDGSGSFGQPVLDGGAIFSGTVKPAGLTFSQSDGTLSGVTRKGAPQNNPWELAPLSRFASSRPCLTIPRIEAVPQLQHDPLKAEGLDTNSEDHAADAIRYGCMAQSVPDEAEKCDAYQEMTDDSYSLTDSVLVL
jgi:hypothetical protein